MGDCFLPPSLPPFFLFLKNPHLRVCVLILESEEVCVLGGGERHPGERNDRLPPTSTLTGVRTCNLGVRSHRGSNPHLWCTGGCCDHPIPPGRALFFLSVSALAEMEIGTPQAIISHSEASES